MRSALNPDSLTEHNDMTTHQVLPNGSTNAIYSVDYSNDGKYVVAGSLNHRILVWDTDTWMVRKFTELHADGVAAVRFSPNGDKILTGGLDKVVKLVNTSSLIAEISLAGSSDYVQSVAFLGDDGEHFASTGFDKKVRIWTTGGQLKEIDGMTGRAHSVDTSPDGKHILSGSIQSEVFLWSREGDVELKQIHHTKGVHAVAFAKHTSDLFATAGGDGKVTVWNRARGEIQGNFRGHKGYIRGLTFSRDGKWLASGGQDGRICVWSLETFRLKETLQQHTNTVYSLAFSPDGHHLVSGSFDRQVIHWTFD